MRLHAQAFFEELHNVFGVRMGDVSNMNGGWFFRHTGHQTGLELDLYYAGYNDLDAAVANKLIQIINHFLGFSNGFRITEIYAAYPDTQSNHPFTKALSDAPNLMNGLRPSVIIRPDAGHTTHFHINLAPLARYPR